MKVIVGSGRLASLLVTMVNSKESFFIYGRNRKTVDALIEFRPSLKVSTKENLANADQLFLCLPAEGYSSFFEEVGPLLKKGVTIYHMATALSKEDVITYSHGKKVVPLKLAGHALQAKRDQDALFVVEQGFKDEIDQIRTWFPAVKITVGSEADVLRANSMATKAAVRMIIELKKELEMNNLSASLVDQMIKQTVSGVIRGYVENDLGHFAKKIAEDLEGKGGTPQNENG
ncbi:hypothetical protein [Bacillus suaedae]|uniref:Pyrroline-5-carboxylate reductase catalytic N-terminal domain-containing protein n=1 Tax=Halalkalibacter suaedae TaxID=2822140 RepID=A0A940WSV7_9BACI|nr:hypothetical protein [Bacillus suaedae]MBP3949822.1 hypothetical protein [Bacillus suaedae]